MKEEIYRENYRIEVEPKFYRNDNHKRIMTICEDIVRQIKRHVDGVGVVATAWDSTYICSHCYSEWDENDTPDEDWPLGIPLCCTKAQEEWKEKNNPTAGSRLVSGEKKD